MSCLSSVPEKCLELFRKGSLASVKDPFSFSHFHPRCCCLARLTRMPGRAVNLLGIAPNKFMDSVYESNCSIEGGIITIKGDVRSFCCS